MKESKKYLPRSLIVAISAVVVVIGIALAASSATTASLIASPAAVPSHASDDVDYWGMVFVFLLSAFIGLGVIRRVSRLLHTPLMSLTNAISAIAVVGAILVAGPDYPTEIRVLGLIALFASVTNIVSGFLITDRMLKMFKKD
ncbi:MAG: NAD(P) transhydrogenase subunit alpha, partial [Pseudomonadota bacterium]|nr:NAD(P) transhydrogenase subunit alpha [Pseudomonadota bacterium]